MRARRSRTAVRLPPFHQGPNLAKGQILANVPLCCVFQLTGCMFAVVQMLRSSAQMEGNRASIRVLATVRYPEERGVLEHPAPVVRGIAKGSPQATQTVPVHTNLH